MKLVRYGKPGKEKPGLIDSDGRLRDLSAVVADIGPDQLGDAALARLRKLTLCHSSKARPAWAARSPASASSLRLA